MKKIVPIVEGPGEVEAVPVILRRLLHERFQRWDIEIAKPKNAHGCSNLTPPERLERFVQYACLEPGCSAVLVLLDADNACPWQLVERLVARIKEQSPHYPVAFVIANCEYEAWFLAGVESLAASNKTKLPTGTMYSGDVEERLGAKEWLTRQMPKGTIYKETDDQPAMSALVDFGLIYPRSRSFRRLCHAIEEILVAIDTGTVMVTPDPGSQA